MTGKATAIALTLLVASPSNAREFATPVVMTDAVAAKLKALPKELAGLKLDGGYSRPLVAYSGRIGVDPIVAVAISDTSRPIDWSGARLQARSTAQQAGLLETLFEGRFAVADQTPTTAFFGDYLTKAGVKQSWLAEVDGVRMTIVATIYKVEDRKRIFDAIRRDLLGGAYITEQVGTRVVEDDQ